MAWVHQETIEETFFPNFTTRLNSVMRNGYFVKAILLDHENRGYWALMERQSA